MSFNKWAAAQDAKLKNKSVEKPKTDPATSEPANVVPKTKPGPSDLSGQTAQSVQAQKS